jgi:NAD(P)-dependent dehydrogenase (short-subunit alcohol dehydrogenase family)
MVTTISSRTNVVFITGATQGIGLQLARILSTPTLHPEYHVIIGALTDKEGFDAISLLLTENPSRSLSTVTIDVTCDSSISTAVRSVDEIYGRIDVLFSNAGVCIDGLTTTTTWRSGFEQTFQVNTFGAAAVTEAFTPLLTKSTSPCPRIVYMTSRLGSLTVRSDFNDVAKDRPFPMYRASKAALNMVMLHYADTFESRGWKVNGCDPGLTNTNLGAHSATRAHSVEDGAKNGIRLATLGMDGPTGTFSNKDGDLDW